jgi:hypothetical protein
MDQFQSVQSHHSCLLKLPDEILILISGHLQSQRDLWSLVRVCRRICEITEPFLYTSVRIQNYDGGVSFLHSLLSHPARALHVRHLALHFATGQYRGPVPALVPLVDLISRNELLAPVFQRVWKKRLPDTVGVVLPILLSNLQELSIDFHDGEDKVTGMIFSVAVRPPRPDYLPFLTHCLSFQKCCAWNLRHADHRTEGTLRYWNERGFHWNLLHRADIFLVPTIRYLAIIDAVADAADVADQDTLLRLARFDKSTTLEELHFIGCKIDPGCLAEILRIPRSLRCLTFTEGHGPSDSNDYVNAMYYQWNNLESLKLVRVGRHITTQSELQRLSKLSYLEVGPKILFRSLIPLVLSASFGPHFSDILPPTIEELVLVVDRDDDFVPPRILFRALKSLFDQKISSELVPALKRVTLVCSKAVINRAPRSIAKAAKAAGSEIVYRDHDRWSSSMMLANQMSHNVKSYLNQYRL